MTSGFSSSPLSPLPGAGSLRVEYHLSAADFHALDMFLYDHVVSKRLGFRLRFYLLNMLLIVIGSAVGGVGVGLYHRYLTTIHLPQDSSPVQEGCYVALPVLAIGLCGLIPGSYLHWVTRKHNQERFRRQRRLHDRYGLIGFGQHYHVVLTLEGLTETVSSHEASETVQITKTQVSAARWAAVSGIDVTDEHAFFTIERSTQRLCRPGYLILPAAAFDSEADFHAFVDTARQYRDAALRLRAGERNVQNVP